MKMIDLLTLFVHACREAERERERERERELYSTLTSRSDCTEHTV